MGNCEKGPAAHITQQYINMLIIQHRFAVITFPIKNSHVCHVCVHKRISYQLSLSWGI